MRSTMVPALGLLAAALITGCGTGGSDTLANARGGSSSAGTGATLGGAAGVGGGLGGASANNGGSAGMLGSGGSGGVAGSAAGAAGGLAGTAGNAGAAGTSSGAAPLFSDDFEGGTIDTSKWTARINGGASFSLDTTQKHGGNQSVHVKQTGFSSMLAAEGAPIFPAPNNTYYARLWLRVASDTGGLTTGHVVWFETGDVTNDTHEVRVGANLGYFQSNLYYQGEVDIRDPAALMTTEAWHCIQVEYGNDLLDVKLDGVHSSISTSNWVAAESVNGNTQARTNWAPAYAAFRIGWELGSGEIWFDDVALDHVPVPCN